MSAKLSFTKDTLWKYSVTEYQSGTEGLKKQGSVDVFCKVRGFGFQSTLFESGGYVYPIKNADIEILDFHEDGYYHVAEIVDNFYIHHKWQKL